MELDVSGVDVVTTYEELLTQWVADFAANKINFLMLIGTRGTGKTTAVKDAMRKAAVAHLYHKGVISARMLYEKLYIFRDCPVLLDDVTSLLGSADCADLVMGLTDTDGVKTINYGKKNLGKITCSSTSGTSDEDADDEDDTDFGEEDLPDVFTTSSKVCLIANGITKKIPGAIRESILDKATIIRFQPSAEEIHRYGKFFRKQSPEIYDWIGANLHRIPQHSLRYYVKAFERRHRDWQEWLKRCWTTNPKWARFLDILHDASLPREFDKVKAFIAAGLGNKATYYRWKLKHASGQVEDADTSIFA